MIDSMQMTKGRESAAEVHSEDALTSLKTKVGVNLRRRDDSFQSCCTYKRVWNVSGSSVGTGTASIICKLFDSV